MSNFIAIIYTILVTKIPLPYAYNFTKKGLKLSFFHGFGSLDNIYYTQRAEREVKMQRVRMTLLNIFFSKSYVLFIFE